MASDPSDLDIFGYLDYLSEQCTCNPVDPACSTCRERQKLEKMLGAALMDFRMRNALDWLDPSAYELAMLRAIPI